MDWLPEQPIIIHQSSDRLISVSDRGGLIEEPPRGFLLRRLATFKVVIAMGMKRSQWWGGRPHYGGFVRLAAILAPNAGRMLVQSQRASKDGR